MNLLGSVLRATQAKSTPQSRPREVQSPQEKELLGLEVCGNLDLIDKVWNIRSYEDSRESGCFDTQSIDGKQVGKGLDEEYSDMKTPIQNEDDLLHSPPQQHLPSPLEAPGPSTPPPQPLSQCIYRQSQLQPPSVPTQLNVPLFTAAEVEYDKISQAYSSFVSALDGKRDSLLAGDALVDAVAEAHAMVSSFIVAAKNEAERLDKQIAAALANPKEVGSWMFKTDVSTETQQQHARVVGETRGEDTTLESLLSLILHNRVTELDDLLAEERRGQVEGELRLGVLRQQRAAQPRGDKRAVTKEAEQLEEEIAATRERISHQVSEQAISWARERTRVEEQWAELEEALRHSSV